MNSDINEQTDFTEDYNGQVEHRVLDHDAAMQNKVRGKREKVDVGELLTASMPEYARKRKPIATFAMIAVSTAMMAVTVWKYGIDPDSGALGVLGANIDWLTLGGQSWRLLFSSFLHAGLMHFACNMLCLYSFGCILEKLIGSFALFCVYVLTSVSGSLLSCVFHENTACVGASCAVFGLFGATITFVAVSYRKLGIDITSMLAYMKSGLFFLGFNLAYSFLPGIDMAGHVGGLLGGLVLGALLGFHYKFEGFPAAKFCRGGVYLATAVAMAVMIHGLVVFGTECRLTEEALAVEVGNALKENIGESLSDAGADNVAVDITDLTLKRIEGDNYNGILKIKLSHDGRTDKLSFRIKVEYNGESFGYELQE